MQSGGRVSDDAGDAKDWSGYSAQVLRDLMFLRRVGYKQLAIALGEETRAFTNRVNRGTFSFSFFVRCTQAMGVRLQDIPWRTLEEHNQLPGSDGSAEPSVPESVPK